MIPSGQSLSDDLDGLQSRVKELEAALAERAAKVTSIQADLAAFKIRYRQEVGLLHEELDELERAIDEAELGELARRAEQAAADPARPPASPPSERAPRYTSDGVRKLFRDVAKTIHPDLARDESARDRRHRLMIEANRAYAMGDEERLRSILQVWENSPEAVEGTDREATRLRLVRRIAEMEDQLNACAAELASLQESALWKLKAMVDEAATQGKDLIADMVRRLKRDILAARNRLDAMQWRP